MTSTSDDTTLQPGVETSDASDKLDFKKILPIFVIVLIDLMGLLLILAIRSIQPDGAVQPAAAPSTA